MKLLSLTDLERQANQEWQQWLNSLRIGNVSYFPEDMTIRLWVYEGGKGFYEVDLERCLNPYEFAQWLFHLKEKAWFKGQIVDDFLTVFENSMKMRNINIHEWVKKP